MNYIIACFLVISVSCQNFISVNGGKLEIAVQMIDSLNILFKLTVNSGDWVGIGFGTNMKNHDMFYVSSNNFHDAYSTGDSVPGDDQD